ncbi:MAG: hypothetical protein ACJAXN_000434 [Psychromonas sp.]|jgi:hypothetical protein
MSMEDGNAHAEVLTSFLELFTTLFKDVMHRRFSVLQITTKGKPLIIFWQFI